MKINNAEKFRNDLYKNLEETFIWTHNLAATFFEKTEDNKYDVTRLDNTLEIRADYIAESKKIYITLDEEANVYIWEKESEQRRFKYINTVAPDYCRTKCSYMMSIAVELTKIIG